jgi:hypothetical protein
MKSRHLKYAKKSQSWLEAIEEPVMQIKLLKNFVCGGTHLFMLARQALYHHLSHSTSPFL